LCSDIVAAICSAKRIEALLVQEVSEVSNHHGTNNTVTRSRRQEQKNREQLARREVQDTAAPPRHGRPWRGRGGGGGGGC